MTARTAKGVGAVDEQRRETSRPDRHTLKRALVFLPVAQLEPPISPSFCADRLGAVSEARSPSWPGLPSRQVQAGGQARVDSCRAQEHMAVRLPPSSAISLKLTVPVVAKPSPAQVLQSASKLPSLGARKKECRAKGTSRACDRGAQCQDSLPLSLTFLRLTSSPSRLPFATPRPRSQRCRSKHHPP
jgi:hypothetical protein